MKNINELLKEQQKELEYVALKQQLWNANLSDKEYEKSIKKIVEMLEI